MLNMNSSSINGVMTLFLLKKDCTFCKKDWVAEQAHNKWVVVSSCSQYGHNGLGIALIVYKYFLVRSILRLILVWNDWRTELYLYLKGDVNISCQVSSEIL